MNQARLRVRSVPLHSGAKESNVASHCPASSSDPGPKSRRLQIEYVRPQDLNSSGPQVHKLSPKQLERIKSSILRFGCVCPILTGEDNEIIHGLAIKRACEDLGLSQVPIVKVASLSAAERAALKLVLNKLSTTAEWDPDGIKANLELIFKFEPDLASFTGFSAPEIDFHLGFQNAGFETEHVAPDPAAPVVSRLGDLFEFAGGHRLLCGDATLPTSYQTLLGDQLAQMVFSDLPYGCAMEVISKTHSRQFVQASGDMNEAQLEQWFATILSNVAQRSVNGAIIFSCIDHRGMAAMLKAGRSAGGRLLAIVTWNKGAGGLGGLYRHASELITVWHSGSAQFINNVQLGKNGRNRTTVWNFPGLAQFGAGRKQALKNHPTVKPLALVMGAAGIRVSRIRSLP